MIAQNCTVLVLHVPKAAGTTLRWIIDRQYPSERVYKIGANIVGDIERLSTLTREKKFRLKVVFGHFWFGIHEALGRGQAYRYVTMLRDPVDRVASLYYYARVAKAHSAPNGEPVSAHYLHQVAHETSLIEFATSGVTQTTDNAMVRQLCGDDRFTMQDGQQVPYDDMVLPFGGVTEVHLEHAQANIEQHFALVGFSEQFDETVRRLKALFAWRVPRYRVMNRTPGKPRSLPAKARSRIEEQNWLDRALYNWALDRFVEGA